MKKIFLLTFLFSVFFIFLFAQSENHKKLIYKFDIKDMINPAVWRTTQRSFQEAEKLNADIIIIHMNTYGGMVESADSIRSKILNSTIPVFIFIDNNAASAGALIAISCDSIYMRKGASIGAATVVNQSGEKLFDKYQSYMRATMRATAEAHGKYTIIENGKEVQKWKRNPKIAEAMVDESIYIPNVIDSTKILTFTTLEAIKNNYCEHEAENIKEILSFAKIENYEIKEYTPTYLDKLISLLLNPYLQSILIMIMVGGIYFELQTPGVGFPITASFIAGILYFAPLYLEGMAENWEIIIFVLGLILIGLEVFVIPGFGVSGVLGIILMILGLSLSLIDNIIFEWDFNFALKSLIKSKVFVTISMFLSLFISILLGQKILTSNNFSFLVLKSTQKKEKGFVGVENKNQEMIGQTGISVTVLRPSGKVKINNKIFDAKAEINHIEKGQNVRVIKYEMGQLYVVNSLVPKT